MALPRQNANLAQVINVSGTAIGGTIFVPSSGTVNINGNLVAGRSSSNDFTINSSGNIGIGNSGNNTYKVNITGNTNVSGVLSIHDGSFANNADSQGSYFVARRNTTDATQSVLTLDGAAPSASNRLTIASQTSWAFNIKISAYNTTDNQAGWWLIRGGIRRNAANSTIIVGSPIYENGTEASLGTSSVQVVADDTNEALEIRVTGVDGKTVRWTATIELSQTSFGTP